MLSNKSVCLREEALAPPGASIYRAAVSSFALCGRDKVEETGAEVVNAAVKHGEAP